MNQYSLQTRVDAGIFIFMMVWGVIIIAPLILNPSSNTKFINTPLLIILWIVMSIVMVVMGLWIDNKTKV
ncbi:MAG: hypothetical protein LBV42_02240 [Methanobrevibacter sp.]|nr:hypothetical protein [Methanobrevibacter sp.]